MFLSFEGIDGAGKSTQLKLLRAALEVRGCEVAATREPGGTSLAETVRGLVLHGDVASRAEMLLFGAARAQHVAEKIRPALERGAWVLCDRFADSTYAYQGGGLGLDETFIHAMNAFATGGLMPHATLLLDLDPACGARRRAGETEDTIEARGLEFQERVRASFLKLAAAEPERIVVLDASADPEALHEEIVRHLRARNLWP
jgi:dTMP kinase